MKCYLVVAIETGALNLRDNRRGRKKHALLQMVHVSSSCPSFFFAFLLLPATLSLVRKRGRGSIARRKKGRVESLICSFVYYAVFVRVVCNGSTMRSNTKSREVELAEWENTNSHFSLSLSLYHFHGPLFADNFESGHLKRTYRRPAISRLCLFYTFSWSRETGDNEWNLEFRACFKPMLPRSFV